MNIVHIKEKTGYFDFPGLSVPFYEISSREIILLDSGYRQNGERIARYCRESGIRVRAVIHSHIHIDHICGDYAFFGDSSGRFYGPMSEVTEGLPVYRELLPHQERHYSDILDMVQAMERLQTCMTDLGNLSTVTVAGINFRLIDAPGHTPCHKIIITPDRVCYLGDTLVFGGTMQSAKVPYAFNVMEDIATKKRLTGMDYAFYIAAHEGHFTGVQLKQVVDRNMAITDRIFRIIREVSEASPDLKGHDRLASVFAKLHIHFSRGTPWTADTVQQYCDYYDQVFLT